jgi:hypothetical protein
MPLIHASDRPRPGRPLQGQHRLQRVQRRLAVGRIYERRGFSPDIRWEWSVHGIVLRRSPRIRSNGCSGRAWSKRKPSFRSAGTRGRRGRSWRRCLSFA